MLLKVNLIKPNHLLSVLNQISNKIQFTIHKSQQDYICRYNDKQMGYKNLDGCLQQTNRLKTVCLIDTKPLTALLNKIPFCFAGGICTIVENENVQKRFKGP